MKKNIILSFVIPAHNEEKTIEKPLQAITSQIKNSKIKCEVIVVNDGSTDNTEETAKKYQKDKVKIINFKTGHSAAFSRNRGAENSTGKYIVFIDADQIIEDNFLNKLVEVISKKDFDVLSYFVYPYEPKTIFQKAWVGFRKVNLCRGFIFRRDVFNKLKFDERLFYIEDNEIWERFTAMGYKLTDTGLKIYHIDTQNLKDFVRQRKWHGKGIIGWIIYKKKYSSLRYFAPCSLLFISYFSFIPLILYLILFWLYFSIKSKDIVNSFLWIIIDYIGRFISLYFFIQALLIKSKRPQITS